MKPRKKLEKPHEFFKKLEDKPIDPDPVKYEIAKTIVKGSIIKRRGEQSLNASSLMWLLFGIGVIAIWVYMLNASNNRAVQKSITRATAKADILNNMAGTPAGSMLPTQTPTPTLILTTETPSPVPSSTPLYSVDYIFKYSYYNPKLGGANCLTWDPALNDCISLMANGEDWRTNYGKVVACPPEIALGTVVEVFYPDALKGYWTCKDRGGLIVGNWIDFLDITQRANWGDPVSVKLYPPTATMDQITAGSH